MWPLIIPAITQLLDKLIPDPQAKAAAQLEVLRMQQSGELANLDAFKALALAQIEVNKVDAAGAPMQRNWRPMVGWVCAAALAWDNIIKPMAIMAAAFAGHPLPALPNLSSEQLYTVLGALLGFGTMRTAEKIKGAA